MSDFDVWVPEEGAAPVKSWTHGVLFEDHAKAQLANVAKLPFIYKHIAVMPDVHAGMGSTVGTVFASQGAVVPAAVGADIACGMLAMNTGMHVEGRLKDLPAVFAAISKAVPHGRTDNGGKHDRGAWHDIPERVAREWEVNLKDRYAHIVKLHPKASAYNTVNHLGTLGTGNHFIEVSLDENDYVWIVLHSGSRGLGARLGSYFTELAKQEMNKWYIKLPDYNLSYLPKGTEGFDDYIYAVEFAKDYACANRMIMLHSVLDALHIKQQDELIECHHNYIATENHFGHNVLVTRKGAIRARLGDMGIIPGSMGAKSYIVQGKGERESFMSCSHGAGRKMSRTEALKQFTVKEHTEATEGVVCRKDASVLDETPAAYKDIDAVLAAQAELCTPTHTLKQVLCVKG